MGRLRWMPLAIVLVAVIAGCEALTTIHTRNPNFDQVWIGTLDAVSNYLCVDRADQQKGIIQARSEGQWERNLARIEIRKSGEAYDLVVGAYVETSTVMTRPAGLKTLEETHLSDLNTPLRDRLVLEIKRRLNVPGGSSRGLRCQQAQMQEVALPGEKQPRVYDVTYRILAKYYEIRYEDPESGVIVTSYSQVKSPEEGIVKVRAIAVLTQGPEGMIVRLKVVKHRFTEKWTVWGFDIIEEEEFMGSDTSLEQRFLYEIQQALGGVLQKPSVALPGKAVPPVTTPAATPPGEAPPPPVVTAPMAPSPAEKK